jgi:peptidoglycan DL-endopeptidase CwlO
MMKRILALCLLWWLAVLPGHSEESAWNATYHTLRRFEKNVRNTFTEDSDDKPSPTPKRRRRSAKRHSSLKDKSAKDPDSANESPTPKAGDSGDASKSSSEGKQDSSGPVEEEKSGSTPDSNAKGESASSDKSEPAAPMATIKPEALREFPEQPPKIQDLIRNSLALTEQNLTYKYGSADPASGGMDCSGFIYYVLGNAGYKDVPRDSAGQYEWVRKQSAFHSVLSRSGDSFELNDLMPGDLLFWSGTYKVDRDIPITHVMIYLGKEKASGKPVMVGSTDGRSYDGIRRFGVSVFDFKMPSGKPNKDDPVLTAKFEGYASIPGLRDGGVTPKSQVNRQETIKNDKETPDPNVKPKGATLGNGD